MKTYDLILVVGYFRTATSLLSVIKGLGRTLRIAVLSVEADSAMHSKTGEAHQVFLHLCQKLGAELLHLGEPAQATLLVVHQFPYTNELARAILHKVTAQKRVGLMTLAMAGREVHDHFLQQFELRKVYVPSQRFLSFLLDKRHAQTRYSNVQIQEVGLPFAKYPLFPEFSADWLIAAPTLFSFHSEQGKQQFLNSVLELLEKIPPQDVVVYKSHNGNSLDYFVPRAHYHLANWLEHVPGATKLVWLAQRLTHALPWRWPHLQIQRLQTCMLHRAVLRRAMPMPAVTQYAGISLEAFLPGVRKGVIGGLSNTIWGTLYFNLPYYNCVDQTVRPSQSELLNKRSDALLDLNLQYFGVPFCQGNLATDTRTLGIVQPIDRTGDLVAAIQEELQQKKDLQPTLNTPSADNNAA